MRIRYIRHYGFTFLGLFVFSLGVNAQNEDAFFDHTLKEEKKPWTNKTFYNDPDNFQFAIVSDRTGGHREGVFGKGLEKINQLYPEFVMSVGDLIEGYTKDTVLINEMWDEFHGILDSLNTRFFYVAGNHDYSNSIMAEQWKARYGRDYYHFVYKDVLFLVVNSNDGDGVLMGNDQIEFLKAAITQHEDVRWTMIFMHHPLWTYGEVNGFSEVETTLKGRNYTVFAGHTHRYLHEVRNDQNHYVLGTTGGGSKLRGPKFGEYDHVGWVTMTDSGPKLVNLALSGIIDHDVSNGQSVEQARALIGATDFKPLVLSKDRERKIILSMENPSDRPMYFKGQLYHHHQVEPDSSRFTFEILPGAHHQLTIRTKPSGNFEAADWDPLELEWKMGYTGGFMEPEFSLSGTEVIELNSVDAHISITEQDIFLDELRMDLSFPHAKELSAKYTLDGTVPDMDSASFPEYLDLEDTSMLQVLLVDSQGFKTGVLAKEYRKVRPAPAMKPKKPQKGLTYAYYEGKFLKVPNFEKLTPITTGIALELDPDKIGQRLDHYAIQYQGYINIPETGVYTFYLTSDDGAKLFIDENLAVDNDGSHDTSTKKGMVALKKGWHPVRIDYFEDFLGERLELQYSSEGREKSKVAFWH